MVFLAPILPSVIVFLVSKRKWLKATAAIIWLIGCIVSGVNALLYLIGTAIWFPIIALIVWLVRRAIMSK